MFTYLPAHLTDHEVGCRESDLKAGGKGNGAKWAMWGDTDVVGPA